jgi:hypothetical protein
VFRPLILSHTKADSQANPVRTSCDLVCRNLLDYVSTKTMAQDGFEDGRISASNQDPKN